MDVLARPAEEFGNDQMVESIWAYKAYEHAEVYFNILSSVDPKLLRLTAYDDAIYRIFRTDFPDLDVKVVDDDQLKSPEAKALWRQFCGKFEGIDDYSFGTLLRTNAHQDYSEQNSILVTRIQFYAIELARNREGINDPIRKIFNVA